MPRRGAREWCHGVRRWYTQQGSMTLLRTTRARSTASGKPSAREPGTTHPQDDAAIPLHEIPDHSTSPVLGHREDRPLVDSEIVGVEPGQTLDDATVMERRSARAQRRIERVDESIPAEQRLAVPRSHRDERWNDDLGRKGD